MQAATDDLKLEYVTFNCFPFINIVLTVLKPEEADMTVDDGPHDWLTANVIVFDVSGDMSSTVETIIYKE